MEQFKKNKTFLNIPGIGVPGLLWFSLFVFFPLFVVVLTSFLSRSVYGGIEFTLNIESYKRLVDFIYGKIFFQSLILAVSTTLITLVLSVPLAWSLVTFKNTTKWTMITILFLPFLVNLIVRILSLKLFFSANGPFVAFITWFGIDVDIFTLTQNRFLVLYGMVTTYLPFMLFPIFVGFDRFDFRLLEAHYDLGGNSWQGLRLVIIPNLKKPIFNGSLMVFIPCMAEFVIPDLLGGAKNMLIGNLITEQFLKARDWPFGSSMAVILLVILLSINWITESRLGMNNYDTSKN